MSQSSDSQKVDEPAGFLPCKTCREPIRVGAQKCIHCDSFQDWRRNLNVSSSVLAMLVALVSVLGATLPAWRAALATHDSKVHVSFAGVNTNFGVLEAMVSNTGDRPAVIASAWLYLKKGEEGRNRIRLEPRDREARPDTSIVNVFHPATEVTRDWIGGSKDGCTFGIKIASFRGNISTANMDVSFEECRDLLESMLNPNTIH